MRVGVQCYGTTCSGCDAAACPKDRAGTEKVARRQWTVESCNSNGEDKNP